MRFASLLAAFFLVTGGLSFSAQVALADDPPSGKKNLVALDLAQVDEDFAYQGEFTGNLWWPNYGNVRAGLQVVALGDGKFDAVLLRGGLPGAGWDLSPRLKLTGSRDGSTLLLAGEDLKINVTATGAQALHPTGSVAGNFVKTTRKSPYEGLTAPSNARILFSGKETTAFEKAKVTDDGLLLAGFQTKQPVGDFRLHVEFKTPYMPYARGQGRANSGVYIQTRYEVQVLDSFGLEGIENECGSLYRQKRPDVNMCLPPLSWQTYDIYFSAPKWSEDGKTKIANARITVIHNGVPVHWHREIIAKTGGGKQEAPSLLPINFQDHSNPVMFRNIWIVDNQGDWAAPSGQVATRGRLLRWLRPRCR